MAFLFYFVVFLFSSIDKLATVVHYTGRLEPGLTYNKYTY